MSLRRFARISALAALAGTISLTLVHANDVDLPRAHAAGDGAWSAVLPCGRYEHTAVYDGSRDRLVVFGGGDPEMRNDVWTLPLSGTAVWSPVVPLGDRPAVRFEHAAIYDPIRDRLLVFAGNKGLYPPYDDLWELSFSGTPTWTKLTPAGTPPFRRQDHTAIYDPVRDRVLVFAGFNGTIPSNDVWALSLSGSPAWTQLATTGTPPTARWGHSAIYDPVRDRMLVFGGYDGHVFGNDVWSLNLSGSPAWTQLTPSGTAPSGRWEHTTIYDPVRDRMILYGGANFDPGVTALELTGGPHWTTLSPSGTVPAGRSGHAAFYDPPRDRMVVVGGNFETDELRALSFAGTLKWSVLPPVMVPRQAGHTSIHDPLRDRMINFAGYYLWELPLAGPPVWSKLTASGSPPTSRTVGAIYDPLRDRMLLFGARTEGQSYPNDVTELSLSGSPTWSLLLLFGDPPPGRDRCTVIYDPVRDRMIVFGGGGSGTYRNDVWALALSGTPTWSQLVPTGSPPGGRYDHAAIYDPIHDRMVVFGGKGPSEQRLGDLWALSLTESPEWTQLSPPGTAPPAMWGSTAIYDSERERMVVFGGSTQDGAENGAWALAFSGGTAWKKLNPSVDLPEARSLHTSIYDPTRDEMVVFGGFGHYDSRNDVWKLSWDFLVNGVPRVNAPSSVWLAAPRPNPAHAAAEIRYELAAEGRVNLDVLDIQGRIVRRLRQGVQPAGAHRVKFERRDDRGRALPAGVYLIRLSTRDAGRTARIVLLP